MNAVKVHYVNENEIIGCKRPFLSPIILMDDYVVQ